MTLFKKKLPDFIIVGAMKSGTSSLSFHLVNHPEICIPEGEMHFFNKEENFQKGPEWYMAKLCEGMNEDVKVVGEKTPTYAYLDHIAEKIYNLTPKVKLIWIFRNPVDRSYSNYLHALKSGREYLSFERAMERENLRIKRNIFRGYLRRSIYYKQVENYLRYFPKSQMHFMLFEDLIADFDNAMSCVFSFLGVAPSKFVFRDEVRNKTVLPRLPLTLWMAGSLFGYDSNVYKKVRKLNLVGQKPGYKKLSPEMRQRLLTYFEEPNAKLAAIIGKDLSCWNR